MHFCENRCNSVAALRRPKRIKLLGWGVCIPSVQSGRQAPRASCYYFTRVFRLAKLDLGQRL